MIEMEKPNIECVDMSEDGKYGKFVVSPLERGYGTTLGNSLRRILLSSLPGAAATSIKIEGVQHEFSTMPGVTEDVTELILNIKKLALKIHGDLPKTVYIEAKGAQESGTTVGTISYLVGDTVYKEENIVTADRVMEIDLKWCGRQILDRFLLIP